MSEEEESPSASAEGRKRAPGVKDELESTENVKKDTNPESDQMNASAQTSVCPSLDMNKKDATDGKAAKHNNKKSNSSENGSNRRKSPPKEYTLDRAVTDDTAESPNEDLEKTNDKASEPPTLRNDSSLQNEDASAPSLANKQDALKSIKESTAIQSPETNAAEAAVEQNEHAPVAVPSDVPTASMMPQLSENNDSPKSPPHKKKSRAKDAQHGKCHSHRSRRVRPPGETDFASVDAPSQCSREDPLSVTDESVLAPAPETMNAAAGADPKEGANKDEATKKMDAVVSSPLLEVSVDVNVDDDAMPPRKLIVRGAEASVDIPDVKDGAAIATAKETGVVSAPDTDLTKPDGPVSPAMEVSVDKSPISSDIPVATLESTAEKKNMTAEVKDKNATAAAKGEAKDFMASAKEKNAVGIKQKDAMIATREKEDEDAKKKKDMFTSVKKEEKDARMSVKEKKDMFASVKKEDKDMAKLREKENLIRESMKEQIAPGILPAPATKGSKRSKKGTIRTGKPVPQDARRTIDDFVQAVLENGVIGFRREFFELRRTPQPDMKGTVFAMNPDKNRYKDVVCLDSTRVPLTLNVPPETDYIHANWVKMKDSTKVYIACQAPLDNTISDFWRLCFQHSVTVIVALCNTVECGKRKSTQYWPLTPGQRVVHGCMLVVNRQVTEEQRLLTYTLEVTPKGAARPPLVVRLMHLAEWPDRGVPEYGYCVLRIIRKIPKRVPCIVHCSAGIGRTGTLIAIDTIIQRLFKCIPANVKSVVQELRAKRACSVQTEGQYVFIVSTVLTYIMAKMPDEYQEKVDSFRAEVRKAALI